MQPPPPAADGHVKSSDGVLEHDLTLPKEIGGPGKAGATNPEQLFAAGYSACFGSAISAVAGAEKIHTGEVTVTADVTLHIDPGPDFYLSVKLAAKIDGVDHAKRPRSWCTRRMRFAPTAKPRATTSKSS